jgi:hypothetical protein
MSRGTNPGSSDASMISVSFIAGSGISTADCALSYIAPSTISAHFTSSATGAALNPNWVAATFARKLVQEM